MFYHVLFFDFYTIFGLDKLLDSLNRDLIHIVDLFAQVENQILMVKYFRLCYYHLFFIAWFSINGISLVYLLLAFVDCVLILWMLSSMLLSSLLFTTVSISGSETSVNCTLLLLSLVDCGRELRIASSRLCIIVTLRLCNAGDLNIIARVDVDSIHCICESGDLSIIIMQMAAIFSYVQREMNHSVATYGYHNQCRLSNSFSGDSELLLCVLNCSALYYKPDTTLTLNGEDETLLLLNYKINTLLNNLTLSQTTNFNFLNFLNYNLYKNNNGYTNSINNNSDNRRKSHYNYAYNYYYNYNYKFNANYYCDCKTQGYQDLRLASNNNNDNHGNNNHNNNNNVNGNNNAKDKLLDPLTYRALNSYHNSTDKSNNFNNFFKIDNNTNLHNINKVTNIGCDHAPYLDGYIMFVLQLVIINVLSNDRLEFYLNLNSDVNIILIQILMYIM